MVKRKVFAGPEAYDAAKLLAREAHMNHGPSMRRFWLALVTLAEHQPYNRVSVVYFGGYSFQIESIYDDDVCNLFWIGLNYNDRNSGFMREVSLSDEY